MNYGNYESLAIREQVTHVLGITCDLQTLYFETKMREMTYLLPHVERACCCRQKWEGAMGAESLCWRETPHDSILSINGPKIYPKSVLMKHKFILMISNKY
jgi:hypothetical protein